MSTIPAIQLTDSQQTVARLVYRTLAGNEVPPPVGPAIPAWSTDRPDVILLEPGPDSLSTKVISTGKLGEAELRLSLNPGGSPVAKATVVVVAGPPNAAALAFDAPTSRFPSVPGSFV